MIIEREKMNRLIEVHFWVDVPEKATKKEIEEWIKFSIGLTESLSLENPMFDRDLEPNGESVEVT